MRAWILLVLAACQPHQVSEPTPVAKPKDCERMADHMVGLMQPKDKTDQKSKGELDVIDKLTNMLIKLCTEQKWSVDAQQCFLGIPDIADAEKCASLLTIDQRDGMVSAVDQAFPRNPSSPPPPASGIP